MNETYRKQEYAQRILCFADLLRREEKNGFGIIETPGNTYWIKFDRGLADYSRELDLTSLADAHLKKQQQITVADIGCGKGNALLDFKRRYGARVHAIGFDLARLSSHAHIDDFVEGNFETIPIPNELLGSCQVVISANTFAYFLNPKSALQKAATLLANSGHAYIDTSGCAITCFDTPACLRPISGFLSQKRTQ